MIDDGRIAFLAEGASANLEAYDASGRSGRAPEEAAYHALECAGLLRRVDPRHALIAGLHCRPKGGRARLSQSGCGFVSGFTLADRLARLLSKEELSDDDLDEVEALLVRRDGLESALVFAADLASDALDHAALRAALLRGREVASLIDDVLCRRPDVLCVAARILEPAADSPPWLTRVTRLDRAMEDASLEVLRSDEAAAHAGPAAGTDREVPEPTCGAALRDAGVAPAGRRAFNFLLRQGDRAVIAAHPTGRAGGSAGDGSEPIRSPDGLALAAFDVAPWKPDRLRLSVELPAEAGGVVRAEVLAEDGQPILRGYLGAWPEGGQAAGQLVLGLLPLRQRFQEASGDGADDMRAEGAAPPVKRGPLKDAARLVLTPVPPELLSAADLRDLEDSLRATNDARGRAALFAALAVVKGAGS